MRVLEITSELDGGGVDRLLYDYCSRIIPEIEFDFVVTSKFTGILEKPLEELGCKVYHIPQMHENFKMHNAYLERILKEGNYDVVHDHSGYKAAVDLGLAKKCGINVRIAHSHQAFIPESTLQRLIRKLITPLTKCLATDLFACGQDAAKWMWGDRQDVFLMRNAIDTKVFSYNEITRKKLREQFGIQNKFVIGNVARFSFQKNHDFLIKIFKEITKINEDAVLMLVGQGELLNDIKAKVEAENLKDKILFLGVRNDVHDLYNAMDVFFLPSRFEGLPVTLIEVQTNGLCSVVADSVTKEMKIADNMYFLPLEEEIWIEKTKELNKVKPEGIDRGKYYCQMRLSAYEINFAVDQLIKKYKKSLEFAGINNEK